MQLLKLMHDMAIPYTKEQMKAAMLKKLDAEGFVNCISWLEDISAGSFEQNLFGEVTNSHASSTLNKKKLFQFFSNNLQQILEEPVLNRLDTKGMINILRCCDRSRKSVFERCQAVSKWCSFEKNR
jgi:hypothetical protein